MWYNGQVDFQKNFLHTLLRAQQPIAVNVPCLLPTVSLNYYASVSYWFYYSIFVNYNIIFVLLDR